MKKYKVVSINWSNVYIPLILSKHIKLPTRYEMYDINSFYGLHN